jgi:hypothetical protein
VVQWVTASPLWDLTPQAAATLAVPEILRFESEHFMDELAARLAARGGPDLSGLPARWESFRERGPGDADDPPDKLRRLYQPAHGRFYLLAANLVCRLPGLPDHVVDAATGEKAVFVLRRPGDQGSEECWALAPQDPRRQRRLWKKLDASAAVRLDPDEERLPLFPANYLVDGKKRRLLVGLVPSSSGETFRVTGEPLTTEGSPVVAEGESRIAQAYELLNAMQPPTGKTAEKLAKAAAAQEEQEHEASRFLLLDFADLLQSKLPGLWNALQGNQSPKIGDDTQPLYATLQNAHVEGASSPSWAQAIKQAWIDKAKISAGEKSSVEYSLRLSDMGVETLRQQLKAALSTSTFTPPPPSTEIPKLEKPGEQPYVLRCAYLRPRCGVLHDDVVSAPTAPFTLAGYFDADAPVRPIRIQLPLDTSVAALRRFKKSVGVVMGKQLRKQISRVIDAEKTIKKEMGPGDEFALGEICSFSLPIITLCALIVLMIMLGLLNMVFWWIPFLKICFPVKK